MTVRCDRCRFFRPHPPASRPGEIVFSAQGIRGGGECRRRPPTGQELQLACFPVMAHDGWCGEFEAAPAT